MADLFFTFPQHKFLLLVRLRFLLSSVFEMFMGHKNSKSFLIPFVRLDKVPTQNEELPVTVHGIKLP